MDDKDRNRNGQPGEDFFRLRRRRNVAIALSLAAFVMLIFLYSIVRFSEAGGTP